jgi:hypothetical protein
VILGSLSGDGLARQHPAKRLPAASGEPRDSKPAKRKTGQGQASLMDDESTGDQP